MYLKFFKFYINCGKVLEKIVENEKKITKNGKNFGLPLEKWREIIYTLFAIFIENILGFLICFSMRIKMVEEKYFFIARKICLNYGMFFFVHGVAVKRETLNTI